MNLAAPIIALLPDITAMIVQRVFYSSPADLYMRRQKLSEANPKYLIELDKIHQEQMHPEGTPLAESPSSQQLT